MKKALLWLLLLTAPFTFGCPPPRNENAATVNSNTNQAVAANTDANNDVGLLARDQKKKAVQLAVHEYNGNKLAIAPVTIRLHKDKEHKLRFSAFNGLEVDIGKIEIDFTAHSPCPFEGGCLFTISPASATYINSGTESDSETRKAIRSRPGLSFKYKVRVYATDDSTLLLPELDPEVEIVN